MNERASPLLEKEHLSRFGTRRDIISDGGYHFCKKIKLLEKYRVRHNVTTFYYQTSGQVKVSYREIK